MYSIQQLASLAGTTTRTLRHYDAIGLLVASRDVNGYRRYSSSDAERLQLILLYRTLDVPLDQIEELLDSTTFNRIDVLSEHIEALRQKAAYFAQLAETAEATLTSLKGGISMDDKSLFDGLSYEEIQAHEAKHREEVQERWSDTSAYKTAQDRAQKRSKADWERINQMQLDLIAPLVDLFRSQVAIEDDRVQSIVKDNHLFIDTHFYDCSLDMFSGLGQMYVVDERFTAFYDRFEPGLAAYYNKAIQYYCIANS